MEQTFSFTVKLSHPVYVALLNESKTREKSTGAVPSRTARQLIEERLEELTTSEPIIPTEPITVSATAKIVAEEDKGYGTVRNSKNGQPKQKAKKPRSRKGEDGADESAST